MCGINGIFNYAKLNQANEESLIQSMNTCIRHRGPDDSGFWKNPSSQVFLGHRRLSIIDLSPAGHQPMVSEKGNAIIFNGEIYNYKEIKPNVKERKFKSESDTEVLLYLYEKYGYDCLSFLNGMFAFAIWDEQKEELFIARDRAGKKPLYYTSLNGRFAFSSEIKALLTLPWIKSELDEKALYYFLTFNQLSPPYTMFKNIFKLEPASFITVGKNGMISKKVYWEVEYEDLSKKGENELQDMVFSSFERSVNYRMVSDVPVGAFLSGGVDSSAIVAMMAKNTSYPIKTYSIGFENAPGYDELKYAGKVARLFGTEHYEKIVTPADIRNFIPKVIEIFDEPLADSTSIPIYFISELARKNGTIVVLTGDGPDELFLGYTNWMKYLNLAPYYSIYRKFPRVIKSIAASFADSSSPVSEMMLRAVNNQEMFWGGANSFKEGSKRDFLNPAYARRMENNSSYEVILYYKELFDKIKNKKPGADQGDWMSYIGFKFLHANRYLFRADRLGMAHSIEGRMPFLDYQFVNLALSIPTKWKVKNKTPKYILKKSFERILPDEVLYRKKQGFNVPIREWAQEVMVDYVESNLKSFCSNWDIFDEKQLRMQLAEIKKGNKNYTNNLWNIYFLIGWFNKWM